LRGAHLRPIVKRIRKLQWDIDESMNNSSLSSEEERAQRTIYSQLEIQIRRKKDQLAAKIAEISSCPSWIKASRMGLPDPCKAITVVGSTVKALPKHFYLDSSKISHRNTPGNLHNEHGNVPCVKSVIIDFQRLVGKDDEKTRQPNLQERRGLSKSKREQSDSIS
jgi:hypothetical protein